ncbi:cytotoxic translational repressor of toxin-antitoxin stability system [Oxynema sp. CENA135]|uniref:cytotoxic translational repressor of toxin-antitoxin stability system n=1 Tax=Oxynema sp. CENA135 TaxID=984206 RepID=UPI00190E385F|nr:cytotoxic translational repressor of toxin-antitoxin stability system [Oxynema sp. CENA135]
MLLDLRYSRAFLLDLHALESPEFDRVYDFVFIKFLQFDRLGDLPNLHQLGSSPIYYWLELDEYLIAIEVMGELVKFLRIIPLPNLDQG